MPENGVGRDVQTELRAMRIGAGIAGGILAAGGVCVAVAGTAMRVDGLRGLGYVLIILSGCMLIAWGAVRNHAMILAAHAQTHQEVRQRLAQIERAQQRELENLVTRLKDELAQKRHG